MARLVFKWRAESHLASLYIKKILAGHLICINVLKRHNNLIHFKIGMAGQKVIQICNKLLKHINSF